MKKMIFAVAASLALVGAAQAQVGKAANEATDAAQHKVDQKQAESKAAHSGPVGKAVNDVKADYHEHASKSDAKKAKKSLDKAAN